MKRSLTKLHALLILLVFSGQVLAAPFLMCDADGEPASMKAMHEAPGSHHMSMGASNADHAGMVMAMPVDMLAMLDCEHVCDVCLSTVFPPEPVSELVLQPTGFAFPGYYAYLPSTHLDTPFRPPISA